MYKYGRGFLLAATFFTAVVLSLAEVTHVVVQSTVESSKVISAPLNRVPYSKLTLIYCVDQSILGYNVSDEDVGRVVVNGNCMIWRQPHDGS